MRKGVLSKIFFVLSPFVSFGLRAAGQASGTGGEFWPLVNVYTQLQPKASLLPEFDSRKGVDPTSHPSLRETHEYHYNQFGRIGLRFRRSAGWYFSTQGPSPTAS